MIARLAHAPDELRPVCRDVYFNPRYRQVNVFCFKRMKQMYMRMSTVDGYVEVRGFIHVSKRSEEHTSELQSLMRISYAVFCLKKKKKTKNSTQHTTQ